MSVLLLDKATLDAGCGSFPAQVKEKAATAALISSPLSS